MGTGAVEGEHFEMGMGDFVFGERDGGGDLLQPAPARWGVSGGKEVIQQCSVDGD